MHLSLQSLTYEELDWLDTGVLNWGWENATFGLSKEPYNNSKQLKSNVLNRLFADDLNEH